MSLIGSLLSLVLIPLKAKQPPKEAENLAVTALADEVRRLNFALNYWRDTGHSLWEENQRLSRDLQSMRLERSRLRAELRELAVQNNQANPYRHPLAQQQASAYQAAMQNYAGCTCVPARASLFAREQPPE